MQEEDQKTACVCGFGVLKPRGKIRIPLIPTTADQETKSNTFVPSNVPTLTCRDKECV